MHWIGGNSAGERLGWGTLARFVEIPATTWLRTIEKRVPPEFRELNRPAFEIGRKSDL